MHDRPHDDPLSDSLAGLMEAKRSNVMRWKHHYGRHIPAEIVRLLLLSDIAAATRTFFACLPHSAHGAAADVSARLCRRFGLSPH